MSHAEFEGIGLLVFVARQDPRQPIARFVLEEHDLIVDRRSKAAGERQVHPIRYSLADRQPRRRIETRGLLAEWIDEGWRELEGIDAEGLLDDFADLGGERRR